jgi:hypothetical protein
MQMIMSAHLKKGRPGAPDASISAAERRIAERNERIILDLIKGRDTSADEESVAQELIALSHLRRRGPSGRTTH